MDYYSEKLDKLLLKNAYEQTSYSIVNPAIPIKWGAYNPILDDYMRLLGHRSWTFISAANPRSVRRTENQNSWANANMEIDLCNTGLNYTYAKAEDLTGHWPLEESFLVFDMGLDKALELAQRYDQHAILISRINGLSRLEWNDL